MDVSQYLYAGLVGAFLILVAAVWLFVRARNPGAARIEPGMGTKAPNDGLVPRAELKAEPEDDEAPPVVDDLANAKAEPPAELGAKAPERPIEQGYKGFKI